MKTMANDQAYLFAMMWWHFAFLRPFKHASGGCVLPCIVCHAVVIIPRSIWAFWRTMPAERNCLPPFRSAGRVFSVRRVGTGTMNLALLPHMPCNSICATWCRDSWLLAAVGQGRHLLYSPSCLLSRHWRGARAPKCCGPSLVPWVRPVAPRCCCTGCSLVVVTHLIVTARFLHARGQDLT